MQVLLVIFLRKCPPMCKLKSRINETQVRRSTVPSFTTHLYSDIPKSSANITEFTSDSYIIVDGATYRMLQMFECREAWEVKIQLHSWIKSFDELAPLHDKTIRTHLRHPGAKSQTKHHRNLTFPYSSHTFCPYAQYSTCIVLPCTPNLLCNPAFCSICGCTYQWYLTMQPSKVLPTGGRSRS